MKPIALFLLCTWATVSSGQAVFQAYPDTNRVRLGEPFAVTATLEPGHDAVWPALDLGERMDLWRMDTLQWDDKAHVLKLTVAAYDSGFVAFPPLMVIQGGDTLTSDPFPIYVEFPAEDPSVELHDIHDPAWVPPVWIIWALVGMKLLWTLLIAFFMLRKRQKPEMAPPVVPLSPWQEAISGLQKMEASRAWETRSVKEFYTGLTDVLRLFGEKTWSIPLMEETTRNIQGLLLQAGLPQDQVHLFVGILEEADLAKFARNEPDAFVRKGHLEMAMEWIQTQKPADHV